MHLIEDNIELIRTELQELANADALIAAQKFHKEKIKAYGIKVPVVRKLAKSWFLEIKQLDKVQIFLMCDALFQSGFSEEAFIAAEWTYILRRKFEEADFSRFEYWIEHHVHNWAICDNFCNNSMGAFLLKYPTYVSHLKRWAVTDNRWLQRAAAVSLIIPAKQGLFSKEILEIAELE